MHVDVAAYIGAVSRRVADRDHDGRPCHVVLATRKYATNLDHLWDAVTSAERIPRWFLPVSGDLKLGGRYQFEGNAGGQITACEPPRLLAVTWEFGGAVSWVSLTLTETPGGASLELEHLIPADDTTWKEYGPGAVGVGWEMGLMGLGLYLATGAGVDREESAAWSMSDEGKAFARQSAQSWRLADIAGGADPTAATTAAERTAAAYTGEA